MKTIYRVAKTELRSLFYSPIAWLLLVAFFIQCGVAYIDKLKAYAEMQQQGGENLRYLNALTYQVFSNPMDYSLFVAVTKNIYLYIPLLTMGLLSRETSSGTIKLLYSSPVKVRAIVFGKYLCMVIFSLLMVALISVFMISGMFHIRNADGGMLWTSAMGLFLLLCTYSAIGLFMSSLTSYQVVAAVCTFVMFGLLSYMGNIWQRYDLLRDIAYFLSMQGRTQNMLSGLVTTKDVIYFLVIIYMFLGLAIYRLRAGRESKPALIKAGRYLAIVLSGLFVGYVSSLPSFIGYYDATDTKSMTLTPNAQRVLKELDSAPLEVTSYNNVLGNLSWYGHPVNRKNLLSNWDIYLRFKPDMHFKMINYYDEPLDGFTPFAKQYPNKTLRQVAAQTALGFDMPVSEFRSPEEISKEIDLRPELNRFVMVLKWKDRTTFLRVFNDPQTWPGETEVSAALKRLVQAHMPKICFVTGDLERSINKPAAREYSAIAHDRPFRNSLINQGFDTDTLNLNSQEIPAGITALVIADPKTELSATAQSRLRQYIERGGNLLIAGEPGKQALINPLLSGTGIQMMDGVIAQPSKQLTPDLVLAQVTLAAALFTSAVGQDVRIDSLPVVMPGVTGLSVEGTGDFSAMPLLMTDSIKSWVKKDRLVLDSADVVFDAAAGDRRRSLPAALGLSRKINGRQQRIVVVGDADFMNSGNLMARVDVKNANFSFCTALFSWLDNGEFPLDTSRPDARDKRVNVTVDDMVKLKILYVWVLPALMAVFGAILLIRRKRK